MIVTNTTFGVNCTGNIKGLLMCLSSVIGGTYVPSRISLRMEGQFPSFGEFYLEQLAAFASLRGIQFQVTYDQSGGVRRARDWQIKNCATDLLWMGDDDCLYCSTCLQWLCEAANHLAKEFNPRTEKLVGDACIGYINGSKPDVNNRRGYGDFSTQIRRTEGLQNGASMNQFYEGPFTVVRTNTMDTGNVLLYVRNLIDNNLWFQKFSESYNSGGEDTLMGLHCNESEAYGYFCPNAKAVHLEKPQINFNEFAARGEMLLRACERLDIPKEKLTAEFMPFLNRPQ